MTFAVGLSQRDMEEADPVLKLVDASEVDEERPLLGTEEPETLIYDDLLSASDMHMCKFVCGVLLTMTQWRRHLKDRPVLQQPGGLRCVGGQSGRMGLQTKD